MLQQRRRRFYQVLRSVPLELELDEGALDLNSSDKAGDKVCHGFWLRDGKDLLPCVVALQSIAPTDRLVLSKKIYGKPKPCLVATVDAAEYLVPLDELFLTRLHSFSPIETAPDVPSLSCASLFVNFKAGIISPTLSAATTSSTSSVLDLVDSRRPSEIPVETKSVKSSEPPLSLFSPPKYDYSNLKADLVTDDDFSFFDVGYTPQPEMDVTPLPLIAGHTPVASHLELAVDTNTTLRGPFAPVSSIGLSLDKYVSGGKYEYRPRSADFEHVSTVKKCSDDCSAQEYALMLSPGGSASNFCNNCGRALSSASVKSESPRTSADNLSDTPIGANENIHDKSILLAHDDLARRHADHPPKRADVADILEEMESFKFDLPEAFSSAIASLYVKTLLLTRAVRRPYDVLKLNDESEGDTVEDFIEELGQAVPPAATQAKYNNKFVVKKRQTSQDVAFTEILTVPLISVFPKKAESIPELSKFATSPFGHSRLSPYVNLSFSDAYRNVGFGPLYGVKNVLSLAIVTLPTDFGAIARWQQNLSLSYQKFGMGEFKWLRASNCGQEGLLALETPTLIHNKKFTSESLLKSLKNVSHEIIAQTFKALFNLDIYASDVQLVFFIKVSEVSLATFADFHAWFDGFKTQISSFMRKTFSVKDTVASLFADKLHLRLIASLECSPTDVAHGFYDSLPKIWVGNDSHSTLKWAPFFRLAETKELPCIVPSSALSLVPEICLSERTIHVAYLLTSSSKKLVCVLCDELAEFLDASVYDVVAENLTDALGRMVDELSERFSFAFRLVFVSCSSKVGDFEWWSSKISSLMAKPSKLLSASLLCYNTDSHDVEVPLDSTCTLHTPHSAMPCLFGSSLRQPLASSFYRISELGVLVEYDLMIHAESSSESEALCSDVSSSASISPHLRTTIYDICTQIHRLSFVWVDRARSLLPHHVELLRHMASAAD